jgi:hypothetical protein
MGGSHKICIKFHHITQFCVYLWLLAIGFYVAMHDIVFVVSERVLILDIHIAGHKSA